MLLGFQRTASLGWRAGTRAAAGSAEARHFRLVSGASGRDGAGRPALPGPAHRAAPPQRVPVSHAPPVPRAPQALWVSGSASPGPDSVARAAGKPVCQRRPGGNGSRTPPLAIRPRGERQGARSPGWETHSPARAPGPLRPSPFPCTSPRALKYPVPEQALGSGSWRPGRATCARLSRAPPPGRSPPAPGHSARGAAPAAFPAPPRPAPALCFAGPSRRPHPARPSVFPVRPAGAVGPVSATPQPGPKEPGRPVGPRGAGEGGAPLFPFPERGLHFALSVLTLSYPRRRKPGSLPFAPGQGPSGVTPYRACRGGLGCREVPLPLRAFPLLETWEGGPGRRAGSCALGWGVTSTFPRRTDCPRAQCFRSGIPVLGPAAACRDRECPVPSGKLRAGPAGLPGPLPRQSRLPGGWGRGRGGGRS